MKPNISKTPLLMETRKQAINPLLNAWQFDRYLISNHSEVKGLANSLLDELLELKIYKRVPTRKKIRDHVQIVLLNLYVAFLDDPDRYIRYSRNENAYQKDYRYHSLFLSYGCLKKVIDGYEKLEYTEQSSYMHDDETKKGFQTRMRATPKLIDKINSYKILEPMISINPLKYQKKIIILREPKKNQRHRPKNIDHEETSKTIDMRENLKEINKAIRNTFIGLRITDDQFSELNQELQSDSKDSLNLHDVQLHRVFSNAKADFSEGGRFYGGWWQNTPREYRKFIRLGFPVSKGQSFDSKPVIEVDYDAHHARMLYAKEGIDLEDSDPYLFGGIDKNFRKAIKIAFLIIFNCKSESDAVTSIKKYLRKYPILLPEEINDSAKIIEMVKETHNPISKYFFTGIGIKLQNIDSEIAELVMLDMLDQGQVTLPVHDSFLVRRGWDDELEKIMKRRFEEIVGVSCQVSRKDTALAWEIEQKKLNGNNSNGKTAMELLGTYYDGSDKQYSKYNSRLERFKAANS